MKTIETSASPDATARATTRSIAAWSGIALSLLLLPATLLGHATVTDQVQAAADAVDARLEQAVPFVEAASTDVDAVVAAARRVASAADSVASTGAFPLKPILDEVEGLSDAYASSRDSYQQAIQAASAAVERLETVSTLVPAGVAQDLRDVISDLERRVQQRDASVAPLLDAPTAGLVTQVAGTIAELARRVESAMTAVAGALDEAAAKLQAARSAVSGRASEITLALTALAVAVCAWLLYTATLNWVLLRRVRR